MKHDCNQRYRDHENSQRNDILQFQITKKNIYIVGLLEIMKARRQWSYIFMKESSSCRRGMILGGNLDLPK